MQGGREIKENTYKIPQIGQMVKKIRFSAALHFFLFFLFLLLCMICAVIFTINLYFYFIFFPALWPVNFELQNTIGRQALRKFFTKQNVSRIRFYIGNCLKWNLSAILNFDYALPCIEVRWQLINWCHLALTSCLSLPQVTACLCLRSNNLPNYDKVKEWTRWSRINSNILLTWWGKYVARYTDLVCKTRSQDLLF